MNCCCPAASRYTFPLAEETGSEYALARVVAGPEDVWQRPLAEYSDVIEYAVKTLYAVGDLLFKNQYTGAKLGSVTMRTAQLQLH